MRKGIGAHQQTKGPNRPLTDEEEVALGTPAELKTVHYNDHDSWSFSRTDNPNTPTLGSAIPVVVAFHRSPRRV